MDLQQSRLDALMELVLLEPLQHEGIKMILFANLVRMAVGGWIAYLTTVWVSLPQDMNTIRIVVLMPFGLVGFWGSFAGLVIGSRQTLLAMSIMAGILIAGAQYPL